MIVPADLTLEKLIGALKVELPKTDLTSDELINFVGWLVILEIIKRELDKKVSK